jgi:hypothetical protein
MWRFYFILYNEKDKCERMIYIVTCCCEVSLATWVLCHTTTQMDGLVSIVTQQCKQAVIEFHSNETVDYQLLSQSGVRLGVQVDW